MCVASSLNCRQRLRCPCARQETPRPSVEKCHIDLARELRVFNLWGAVLSEHCRSWDAQALGAMHVQMETCSLATHEARDIRDFRSDTSSLARHSHPHCEPGDARVSRTSPRPLVSRSHAEGSDEAQQQQQQQQQQQKNPNPTPPNPPSLTDAHRRNLFPQPN